MTHTILHSFVVIAETGSFSKAAQQLYISQPTLSNSIAALERELGFGLFIRDNRGVRLTPAGEVFYQKARGIVQDIEAAVRAGREAAGVQAQSIRIGCNWQDSTSIFSKICDSFSAQYPDVALNFLHCDLHGAVDLLLENAADIGVCYSGAALLNNGVSFLPLFEDASYCLMPQGHPLSQKQSLTVDDLEGETLLLPKPGVCSAADEICAYAKEKDLHIAIRSDVSEYAIPVLVTRYRYIVVAPSYINTAFAGVLSIPLLCKVPIRVGLGYLPRPKPAIKGFLACAQEIYMNAP